MMPDIELTSEYHELRHWRSVGPFVSFDTSQHAVCPHLVRDLLHPTGANRKRIHMKSTQTSRTIGHRRLSQSIEVVRVLGRITQRCSGNVADGYVRQPLDPLAESR